MTACVIYAYVHIYAYIHNIIYTVVYIYVCNMCCVMNEEAVGDDDDREISYTSSAVHFSILTFEKCKKPCLVKRQVRTHKYYDERF